MLNYTTCPVITDERDGSGWYCTLPEGHSGDHEAWGYEDCLHTWPRTDDEPVED